MARAVAAAMKSDEPLLFEAGTGVGKSLAYLVPGLIYAIDTSRQLIVSTHTISLQEQLETSDLPKCRRLFKSTPTLARYADFKSAVLVGKSNYLCTTRLGSALADRTTLFADADYVHQSELVRGEHMRQLSAELDRFAKVRRGLLYFYFNAPDQNCHMMWRNMDPSSPMHASADPALAGRIRQVYQELDGALGLALDRAGPDAIVMVMSDHGFAPWNRAFHVNTWLFQNGYLVLRPGVEPGRVDMLLGVDWSKTRAYAVGLNGLYLNLAGREREGIVKPGADEKALLAELKAKLEAVTDPIDGKPAIKYAYRADEVYHGAMVGTGPDIVMGYHRGWRGSNESALGRLTDTVFTDNMLKWSGDHCMAADEVPGVLLVNRPIRRANPALVDMAPTILKLFGVPVPADMVGGDLFSE